MVLCECNGLRRQVFVGCEEPALGATDSDPALENPVSRLKFGYTTECLAELLSIFLCFVLFIMYLIDMKSTIDRYCQNKTTPKSFTVGFNERSREVLSLIYSKVRQII